MAMGFSLSSPAEARLEVREAAAKPTPPPLQDPGHRGSGAGEIIAVLAAMNLRESDGGPYDPSRRHVYDGPPRRAAGADGVLTVDAGFRAMMLDWCARTAEHLGVDRGAVALSALLQDAYLGTEAGRPARTDRVAFRVASVASFYVAVKLRGPSTAWNLSAREFARLCRGAVSGEEIDAVEIDLLFALGWNINPPTPMEYAGALLGLAFGRGGRDARSRELEARATELVHHQLDVALVDARLFRVRSSVIAAAAVLNSLECVAKSFEGQPLREGASLCREGAAAAFNMMASCGIAPGRAELGRARSALLGSLPSPPGGDGGGGIGGERAGANGTTRVLDRVDSPLTAVSPPAYLSPTSAASRFLTRGKAHRHAAAPQSALSRVFAFHR